MAALFDPFVQTRSGQLAQEGTGLGLPISQQFVRLMGGQITVHSELDRGSTFEFDAPAEIADTAEVGTTQAKQRVTGLAPGQPQYRLLAVDDQEVNRRLLVKLLEPIGFEVREAANGEEALHIWERWHPHLILMDMRMPVMDGYEATRRIKATTQGHATIILALTASALEEDKAVILSEGCDGYLRKPFREEQLFDAIAQHLGVRFDHEAHPAAVTSRTAVDVEEASARELALLAGELRGMSPGWIADLQRATVLGDQQTMLNTIEHARQEHRTLADALERMARRYEHDAILNLIRDLGGQHADPAP
jgi:CheY-like chemotaxis protein